MPQMQSASPQPPVRVGSCAAQRILLVYEDMRATLPEAMTTDNPRFAVAALGRRRSPLRSVLRARGREIHRRTSIKPDDERNPAVSLTIGRAARLLVYESIVLF